MILKVRNSLRRVVIGMALSCSAHAQDAFVDELKPCLDYVQKAEGKHHQLVMGQGWTSLLFELEAKDGGGLGHDLCGELGNGGLEFAQTFAFPEVFDAKGPGIDHSLISAAWLDQVIRAARDFARHRLPVARVTLSRVKDGKHVVRVYFSQAEADTDEMLAVDLDEQARVIARFYNLPDQLEAKLESETPQASVAESDSAPTIDVLEALRRVTSASSADAANAVVARVVYSNFAVNLDYRNGPSPMRQTSINYIDNQYAEPSDGEFEFPAAFMPCKLTLSQVKAATAALAKLERYRSVAKRAQHAILECSKQNPKPHWQVIVMDPFEYFDVDAALK
jgi:hypothetical protein